LKPREHLPSWKRIPLGEGKNAASLKQIPGRDFLCLPALGFEEPIFAGLVVPLFLFVGMAGFIVANSIAGALTDFRERAGSVSALVGALHYGGGIIGSALIGAFADGTPWPLGWVVALAGAWRRRVRVVGPQGSEVRNFI
jgi:hypothetical protein